MKVEEQVVLVNESDNKVGLMGKLDAHKGEGTLHRAVSVLVYRRVGNRVEVLLQQRSKNKPLWPEFWSNTVCTHPRDGEDYEECGVRRLKEEMGVEMTVQKLKFLFKLLYQARYNEALSEHELDGVMVGEWDGEAKINPEEASDYKWMSWQQVEADTATNPQQYTPWFKKLVADERLKAAIGVKNE